MLNTNEKKGIRFGLLGCGTIGAIHARAISQLPGAVLTAVADEIPAAAESFSAQYHTAWESNLPALLARPDIDVVTLCTPSGLHAQQGILVAKAGKHLLCEKPLDLTLEKIDSLIAACQQYGVTLGGVFQNRFHAAAQRAKQLMDSGSLGELVYASASCLWFRPQSYYDSNSWRGTRLIDGGALANQAIHTIDLLLWLTGQQPQVISAYCPTLQRNIESEDLGVALLRFPNGAAGVIQGTTLAYPGSPASITLCGTRGTLCLEEQTITRLAIEGMVEEQAPSAISPSASDPGALAIDNHLANIADFVQALTENRPPLVNGPEARKAVALVEDIYHCAGMNNNNKGKYR